MLTISEARPPMTQSNVVNIPSDWSKRLSRGQFKVALLVARGMSNREVARELGVREGTVKAHLIRIYRRLGVKRRYHLIAQLSARTRQRDVKADMSEPSTIKIL